MIKNTLIATTLASILLVGCGSTDTTSSTLDTTLAPIENTTQPQASDTPATNDSRVSTLDAELEASIVYMVNEEKLAYDVYMNLYNYHISDANALNALTNVALNSEIQHIAMVGELANKYGLQNDSNLPSGEFSLPEIQALYDTLFTQGLSSPQAALTSACMVEVTDINDLTVDIALATSSNASDVVSVFELLRSGSYNHYWAFDSGLKKMGVVDGCCSLGTIDGVNYCHPEYPQNEQGNQDNQGGQNAQGNQGGHP